MFPGYSLELFCLELPKVELHAHLNGSLSPNTMQKLVERKKADKPELVDFKIPDSLDKIDDFFKLFKFIYQLTDDDDSVRIATRDIIDDFAKDNVKYLELRTTPRKNDETDRRNTLDEAQEAVDLAIEFRSQGIVGIDLCGDVSVGQFEDLRPAFERAKQEGFLVTLHFNEIEENVPESHSLLSIQPDRLGHATFLDEESRNLIYEENIPIEICMTSNVLCKTVETYQDHHIKHLLRDNHSFSLCTDDKGVFFSECSNEYKIAAETFRLSKLELFQISRKSIEAIFADADTKKFLKDNLFKWWQRTYELYPDEYE
ncbi:hypothetical protein [Parasitella parasitica]|uniref:Adenosine deaminase domain-containing protein n=1 Tax=Parasitella parasitica TaxID=35722 RepID=A0A0B7N5W4_9FUNG|nr:hypothetical protein [Parasitella parasitica]